MSVSIAIVGAGPAGFYAAAALIKSDADSQVDIIDALPTPYGLVRAGVAPDHQSTKGVARAFAKTAAHPRVAFLGNVRLGSDVSLAELRALYDAVILAVGAPEDRALGIPGGDLRGVYGAAAFVGWYNGHPRFSDLAPDLETPSVCVIGNGNVALDVARVLVKTPEEMSTSDLVDHAAKAIHGAPIRDVYVIGRRGPVEAKFNNKELNEMGGLDACVPLADPAQLPAELPADLPDRDRRLAERNLATLRQFAGRRPDEKPKRLHFVFFARPAAVLGEGRVTALRLERTRVEGGRAVGTGETFDVPCGAVVAAIGYGMERIEGVPMEPGAGVVRNDEGRVDDGLYVVGWARRGPTGVIGTNKADGDLVAARIAKEIAAGGKPGRAGLEARLRARGVRWVSFPEWLCIEAAEVAAAPPGAPRRKLIRIKDMLDVLENSVATVTKM